MTNKTDPDMNALFGVDANEVSAIGQSPLIDNAGTAVGIDPAIALQPNPEALEGSREMARQRAAQLREERESGMRKRTLGGFVRKLDVHGEVPGYHLHIHNDSGNNIEIARQHGYEFVKQGELLGVNGNVVSFNVALNEYVKFLVGVKGDGDPMYGYLMKLPLEIWEDDERERQKAPDNIDKLLQNGTPPGLSSDDLEAMKPHKQVPNRIQGAPSKLYTGVPSNGS